jgi:hypothetical protein
MQRANYCVIVLLLVLPAAASQETKEAPRPLNLASMPSSGEDSIDELPVLKVTSNPIVKMGIMTQGDPSGSRVLLWRAPLRTDQRQLLVRGGRVGDEIISINGREAAAMKRHVWSSELNGYFTITVKRRTGSKSYQLYELDGRGD